MDSTWTIVVGALAVWRATHLVYAEAGPGAVFARLRNLLGDGPLGQSMDCFYCLSLWCAAPAALVLGSHWIEQAMLWLALSAAAIWLERIGTRWAADGIARWLQEPPQR